MNRLRMAVIACGLAGLFLSAIEKKNPQQTLSRLTWVGIGSLVLFFPWFVKTSSGKILDSFARQLTTIPSQLATSTLEYHSIVRLSDIRPFSHALITSPDLRAMEWLHENMPKDSRFLVNSFLAYGESVVVGSDGGWWMPVLAERKITVPPLNYSMEQWAAPEIDDTVLELTLQLRDNGPTDTQFLDLLQAKKSIMSTLDNGREG